MDGKVEEGKIEGREKENLVLGIRILWEKIILLL